MQPSHSATSSLWIAFFLATSSAAPQELRHRPPEQSPLVVICRVMEVHTSADPAVTVVLFHQRERDDAARLRALLRRTADGPAEFQLSEADGWHAARVARLKRCFGRGLLILPAVAPPIAEGATILVRFPVAGARPAFSHTMPRPLSGPGTPVSKQH